MRAEVLVCHRQISIEHFVQRNTLFLLTFFLGLSFFFLPSLLSPMMWIDCVLDLITCLSALSPEFVVNVYSISFYKLLSVIKTIYCTNKCLSLSYEFITMVDRKYTKTQYHCTYVKCSLYQSKREAKYIISLSLPSQHLMSN